MTIRESEVYVQYGLVNGHEIPMQRLETLRIELDNGATVDLNRNRDREVSVVVDREEPAATKLRMTMLRPSGDSRRDYEQICATLHIEPKPASEEGEHE